jgi:hypothetical protein
VVRRHNGSSPAGTAPIHSSSDGPRRPPAREPPLPRAELERLAPFWLERFSDEQVRDMAFAFGTEDASAERVASWRVTLAARVEAA